MWNLKFHSRNFYKFPGMGLTKEKMFIILKKFAKQTERVSHFTVQKTVKKHFITRRKLHEKL